MSRSGDSWARTLIKVILGYGLALAVGAFALQQLEFRLLAQENAGEIYVGIVAIAFLALGVWAGAKLAARRQAGPAFERNDRAIDSLGVSAREIEVLELLAAGRSNKEIAGKLNVSPNTVKTHVSRLYGKLEASRRTEAVLRARELGILK